MKRIVCLLLSLCCLSSACVKKAPEALKVEIYPQADYWAVMDLSDTCFPTEEACEELANRYTKEISRSASYGGLVDGNFYHGGGYFA